MERKISLKCDKALPYLNEANELDKEINEIVLEWQKVDEKVGKMKMKSDKLKSKARPLIADLVNKHKLGEYEVVASFSLDNGEISVKILDMLEMWKDEWNKKKLGDKINGKDDNNKKE